MPDIEELEGEEPWECARCHRTFVPMWDNETEEDVDLPAMSDGEMEICDDCFDQTPEALTTWFDAD